VDYHLPAQQRQGLGANVRTGHQPDGHTAVDGRKMTAHDVVKSSIERQEVSVLRRLLLMQTGVKYATWQRPQQLHRRWVTNDNGHCYHHHHHHHRHEFIIIIFILYRTSCCHTSLYRHHRRRRHHHHHTTITTTILIMMTTIIIITILCVEHKPIII